MEIYYTGLKYIMSSEVQRSSKKYMMHHVQSQRTSKKCTSRGMGVHRLSLSHQKWKLLLFSALLVYFVVPSEFWISIHNEGNRPVLDNYDNKIVRISLNSFNFLLKVNESWYFALFVFRGFIKKPFQIDFFNSYIFFIILPFFQQFLPIFIFSQYFLAGGELWSYPTIVYIVIH